MQQVVNAGDGKLTRNQGLVLSVLEGAGQPLSAYGILDRLRDEGLKAPLQVYRALDKLVEVGRVHRLESMNAFVVCCHSNHGHIHPRVTAFEICDTCGQVSEFHDEAFGGHAAGVREVTTIQDQGNSHRDQGHLPRVPLATIHFNDLSQGD